MKMFSMLLVLTMTQCRDWVKYDACDTRWADMPSAIRKIHPNRKDTICKFDYYHADVGAEDDGYILTVLASGLFSFGVKCGEKQEECNPEVVNRIVGDNYQNPSEGWRLLGIEFYQDFPKYKIAQAFEEGDFVIGAGRLHYNQGRHYAFIVLNIDEVNRIDDVIRHDGIEDKDIEYYELRRIISVKLLNKQFIK